MRGQQPNHEFAHRGKSRAENQGDQQKETNAHNKSEGQKSVFDKIAQPATRQPSDAPNRVERVLELNEDSGCAYDERGHRDNRCPSAGLGFVGCAYERLDRFPPPRFRPNQKLD